MKEKTIYNPYQELANAIVLGAARDYRNACKRLKRGRKNDAAQEMRDECLKFFHSFWFSLLTDLDPDYLIEKLNAEVEQYDG